jgi:hypothetical protein
VGLVIHFGSLRVNIAPGYLLVLLELVSYPRALGQLAPFT